MTSGRFHLTLLLAVLVATVTLTESRVAPVTNKCPQNVSPTDWPTFFAHEDYCTKYYMCVHGQPQEMNCAPGTVFSEHITTCVHAGGIGDTCTPSHPQRECDRGTVDIIPHPDYCQRYYNCSNRGYQSMYSRLEPYEHECRYPEVLDFNRKQCVPYDQAVCGQGRTLPTWECQYVNNLCPKSHCIPCAVRYPSCVSKTDGLWAIEGKEWSPYYVECLNQRTKNGEEQCPPHPLISIQLFHPDKRRCVSLWEIPNSHYGYEPTCQGKQNGVHTSVDAEIISYSCPGKQLFHCIPPLYVDPDINHCTPFPNNAAK